MSDTTPQNFKNHGRLDPPYHMVLAAVLGVNFIVVVAYLMNHFNIFTHGC